MDAALIPTGTFEEVYGTVYDLNNLTLLNDTVAMVSIVKERCHKIEISHNSTSTLHLILHLWTI